MLHLLTDSVNEHFGQQGAADERVENNPISPSLCLMHPAVYLLISLSLSLSLYLFLCVCICVCVCDLERERERERKIESKYIYMCFLFNVCILFNEMYNICIRVITVAIPHSVGLLSLSESCPPGGFTITTKYHNNQIPLETDSSTERVRVLTPVQRE